MVAMLEIAFLIVCAALILWWFSRTSAFRHRKPGAEPDQRGVHTSGPKGNVDHIEGGTEGLRGP